MTFDNVIVLALLVGVIAGCIGWMIGNFTEWQKYHCLGKSEKCQCDYCVENDPEKVKVCSACGQEIKEKK